MGRCAGAIVWMSFVGACGPRSQPSDPVASDRATPTPAARDRATPTPAARDLGLARRVLTSCAEDVDLPVPDLGDDDPYAEIRGLVDAAAAGDRERVEICVLTTMDYGCSCPPFVFAAFYNGGGPVANPYLMPRVGSGSDPADFLVPSGAGSYRFTGRFDGREITGSAWIAERGTPPSNYDPHQREENWEQAAPAFEIESWCFDQASAVAEEEELAYVRPIVERMRQAGIRACGD